MKRLIEIVEKLKSSEILFIKEKLCNGSGKLSKKCKLFMLIADGKVCDDKHAARLIYKKKPDSAFSQLKKRLKQDILNQLTITQPLKNQYDMDFSNELLCHKLIIQGKVLLQRGIRDEGLEILKKAHEISKDFEFNDLRIQISKLLYEEAFFSSHPQEEIRHAERSFVDALSETRFLYLQMKRCIGGKGSFPSVIKLFEDDDYEVKLGDSSKEFFWYKYAVLRELVVRGDCARATKWGHNLSEVIVNTKATNNNKFRGLVELELGKSALWLKDYEKSKLHAQTTKKFHVNNFYLGEQADDLYFRALFFNKEFEEANDFAKKMLKVTEISDNKVLYPKWLFFNSFSHYMLKDRDIALKGLIRIKTNEKGLLDLSLNVRLLELIIAFDNKDIDYLECRLECLRKQLFNYKDQNLAKAKNIFSFFKELSKFQLDFKRTAACSSHILDIVEGIKIENKWSPLDLELMSFVDYIAQNLAGSNQKIAF